MSLDRISRRWAWERGVQCREAHPNLTPGEVLKASNYKDEAVEYRRLFLAGYHGIGLGQA